MSTHPVPHDVSPDPHQPEVEGPAPKAQWVGLLLAPVTFAVHFQLSYLLVLWVCGSGRSTFIIHLSSVLALALALLGAWAGHVAWRRAGTETLSDGEGAWPRTRLMGTVGMGFSLVLALILAAQLVAGFVGPACQ